MVERSRRVDVEGSMGKKMWNTDEFNHVLKVHTEQVRCLIYSCYSKRILIYCDMVERSRRVDVEGSMGKKMWNTDEFNHVLKVHTEQV